MKKDNVTYLSEKKISKLAKTNYENTFVQNPIIAKFMAFKKTKKTIKTEDLF